MLIDRIFRAAPDLGFRRRAVHEYRVIKALLGDMHDLGSARILDFGCGDGIAAASFALRHPSSQVSGIDILEVSADRLRTLFSDQTGLGLPPNLSLDSHSPGSLPAELHNLDIIYAWSVFEHVPFAEVVPTLKLLHDRLGPKGSIVVQIEPLYFSPYGSHLRRYLSRPWEHLERQLDDIRRKVFAGDRPAATNERAWEQFISLNRATADDIVAAAAEAGLAVIHQSRSETSELIPDRLKDVYSASALMTTEVQIVLKSGR